MNYKRLVCETTRRVTKIEVGDVILLYGKGTITITRPRSNRILFWNGERDYDDRMILDLDFDKFESMVKLIAISCGLGVHKIEETCSCSARRVLFEFIPQEV